MFSRILLGAISMVAGVIVTAVPAASAAGPDDDPGADVASSPLPELTVTPPTDYPDVRLFNGDAFSGQAAFNPAYPKQLVVGIWSVVGSRGCYVKRSVDGGRTWGAPVRLPQLADAECTGEPAVAYAAGGARLYAAYAYTKPGLNLSCVAFSLSTDQGATWSTPTNALPEQELYNGAGDNDVRLAAAPDGSRVYVAAQLYYHYERGYKLSVSFSSSDNHGLSWTPVKKIASPTGSYTSLSGFALAAGGGGNVLVAYGWQKYLSTCSSTVRVARSADHGASFLYGTADQHNIHDGDGFSSPDIKIGPFGTAHLVYKKAEAILYKYSFPPYGSWSAAAVRLDDDLPQAYGASEPRLAVGACGQASVLHATWSESLLGSDAKSILYTRKVAQPGYAWSEPLKIGTLKQYISTSGLAAAGPKAFSIFSGYSVSGYRVIAGSRVSSGVTCP